MTESEWTCSATVIRISIVRRQQGVDSIVQSVTSNESNGREWEIDDRCKQWEEAFRVRVWIRIGLVELQTLAAGYLSLYALEVAGEEQVILFHANLLYTKTSHRCLS